MKIPLIPTLLSIIITFVFSSILEAQPNINSPGDVGKTTFASDKKTLNNSETIFIGDSITNNYGWKEYLNAQFGGRLFLQPGESGYHAGTKGYNKGISGNTTTQMLARFMDDVVKQNPRIVFIMGGTNDDTKETATSINNLRAMYTAAIKGGADLVVALGETQSIPSRPHVTAINDWIMTQKSSKILSIRLDQIPDWGADDMSDNLHPNWSGTQKIVKCIIPYLTPFFTQQTVFDLPRKNIIPAFSGSLPVTGQNVSGTIYTGWSLQQFTSTGPTVISSLGKLGDGSPAIVLTITPGTTQDAIHLIANNIPLNGAIGDQFDIVAQIELIGSGPACISPNLYPITFPYYIMGTSTPNELLPANTSFTLRIPSSPQIVKSTLVNIDIPISMSTAASSLCTLKIGKVGAFKLSE